MALALFSVLAAPGAAGVAPADGGSGAGAAQVTTFDAGSTGQSAPCFVDDDGDLVCPCDDYGDLCK